MTRPKFWTFDHPVLDKLPPFKSSKIPILVQQIQAGDDLAKDELLYQFLSYVRTRLGKLIYTDTRLRNNAEGLVSYLIEWLVKLIEQIKIGKPDNNILHYVSGSLRYRCLDYLGTLVSYGPCPGNYKSHQNPVQCNFCLETIPMSTDAIELLEKIQSLATTDNERAYINLRVEGYKNLEIAEILGLTPSDISRIKKSLERRFNESD